MGYQKILVALDRSPQSQEVFDTALAIARQENAALMLFYCLPIESHSMTPYTNLYGEDLVNFSQSIQEQLQKETEEARQWLENYGKIATDAGVATEWDYKVGEAGRWIRDLARSWNADLIVLGRRGLRGLAEMFLGSVSNYVVHHVSCSVLVVQGTSVSETKS